MSKSIPLSPKHGVNPSMITCVFCGEPKGVALCGRLKGDAEAPKYMIADYEPCETCKSNWSKGVALIRTATKPPQKGMPPIQKDEKGYVYPTGGYMVATQEAVKRIFEIDVEKGSCVFLDEKLFDQMAEQSKQE